MRALGPLEQFVHQFGRFFMVREGFGGIRTGDRAQHPPSAASEFGSVTGRLVFVPERVWGIESFTRSSTKPSNGP